ncbi:MAG TPA: prefoldin subunit alpha [Candidatus Diapherotrites archaeon]|uniref:Prefoldin subunit alpha n=1 Tax=Candidatus Iainarchaeum sp. TaxID=3101447 RepID=A0A7J4IXU9_9ARCH|nr:prefoldin subunit alpha [Candidatus Diapherotrites archaeon]
MAGQNEQKVTLTGNQLLQLSAQERQKLSEINRRISSIQSFRNELAAAHDALEEISRTEKGEKALINLGAGVFVQASIEENSKALTSIAGNAFREKPNQDISKALSAKIGALDKNLEGIGAEQQKTIARINQLEQVLSAGRQYLSKQRQA